ncbi:MAG TPA: hypothetical protein VF824_14405 [Thermoanaerobaculia bacterium]|jgi:hypothetical protein
MSLYLEAMLLLLPPEAGGRQNAVEPRAGSYRPFARVDGRLERARLIEGPPRLAPGDAARVMIELESDAAAVHAGCELAVVEHGERQVGVLTVLRVCGGALAV